MGKQVSENFLRFWENEFPDEPLWIKAQREFRPPENANSFLKLAYVSFEYGFAWRTSMG